MNNNLEWQLPALVPVVKEGTEEEFWVAVVSVRDGIRSVHTFLGMYQNRPLQLDEEGDPINDDYLSNDDGEAIESIGWVSCKSHIDFDNFYQQLHFNDNYILLGWAEYTPPEFTILNNVDLS